MEQNARQTKSLDDRVHPQMKEAFAKFPKDFYAFDVDNIVEERKRLNLMFNAMPKKLSDKVETTTRIIPGPKDAPEVFVKIHQPKKRDDKLLPGVLWIHGGGNIFGYPDVCDNWCHRIVEEINCVAVVLRYRLSPENPYPCAIEDCYATLVWMKEAAVELGIDVSRIAVGGKSAGGLLTAGLTLLARDRGGPEICYQMLIYPDLDNRCITPSSCEFNDSRVGTREQNLLGWKLYLGDYADKEDIPYYAVPARATDLTGLPPAFAYVGELDGLRDETIEYVKKLVEAGVPTEFHLYPGCIHGFDIFMPNTELAQQAVEGSVYALKQALTLRS